MFTNEVYCTVDWASLPLENPDQHTSMLHSLKVSTTPIRQWGFRQCYLSAGQHKEVNIVGNQLP